jgi:hypothetical protein
MIMIEMAVTDVKDRSWPIVKVTPLSYIWHGENKEELAAMEQAVFTELRE